MATPFYQSSKGEWVEDLALMLDELWPKGYSIQWSENSPQQAYAYRASEPEVMEVYRGKKAIAEALDHRVDMLPEWDDYDQWYEVIEHLAAENLNYDHPELLGQLAAELSENEGEPGAYTEDDMEDVIGSRPVQWYADWLGGSEGNYKVALDLFGVTEDKVRAYVLEQNYPHVRELHERQDFIDTLWQGPEDSRHFGSGPDSYATYVIYDYEHEDIQEEPPDPW